MNTQPERRTKDRIAIVGGAGHVGLPLGLVLASKGWPVTIYDVSQRALDVIARGQMPFREEGADPLLEAALASGEFRLTADPAGVGEAEIIIVTIGTPIDEFFNPTLRAMEQCFDSLLPHLHDGQTIILRSTVYPGTTAWLEKYLKSRGPAIHISFCPERIVQGFAVEELQRLPQIISGTTPEAEERAAEVFGSIAPDLVRLAPLEAEFAKLFTNAYRYIQFATANQFYMIANNAGVDYSRILAALKKNYPRSRDMPAPGFAAGPCLYKDTVQLAAFAENNFSLGHTAVLVNEGLILYMVDQIAKHHPIEEMTIGLLGMAFKADSDDTRSSLSYKLKKMLTFRSKAVLTTDPYVRTDPALLPLQEVIDRSDLLVLCVPHKLYRTMDAGSKPIVDVWGFLGRGSQI